MRDRVRVDGWSPPESSAGCRACRTSAAVRPSSRTRARTCGGRGVAGRAAGRPRDADRPLAGNDEDGTGGGRARAFERRREEHTDAGFVKLKHGPGPIPARVRDAFDELSGRSRIDALVNGLDELLGPLGRETLPRLEETRREPGMLHPLL